MDIKKCIELKKFYTKQFKNTEQLIVNIEQHPFCFIIAVYKDNTSRGYFYDSSDGESELFLGKNNHPMYYAKDFPFWNESNITIVSNNKEVKRVYKEVFASGIVDVYNALSYVFSINPILFANLADCNVFMLEENRDMLDILAHLPKHSYRRKYYYLYRIKHVISDCDCTKPLIKDAFHLPVKYIAQCFQNSCKIQTIKRFCKYNYNLNKIITWRNSWIIDVVPTDLIPNKEATLKYFDDNIYRDYYSMRSRLSEEARKNFPVNPENTLKYHDRITLVFNRESIQRKEQELNKKQEMYTNNVYKNAIKYEFADKYYSIIACKKLAELYVEGSTLNHCVGSYTDSVSQGREYILFLRKNSELDMPYFTIDVTPDNKVRQIHGKNNCNINSEIEPFIKEWAKKFNLNISDCSERKVALWKSFLIHLQ